MKKVLVSILFALGVGALFGYYFFKDLDREIKEVLGSEDVAYAFQVGVFTDLDNAKELASSLESGTVVRDDELYRVYVAILKSDEAVLKMREYYDGLGMEYYVKRVVINGDFLKKLYKYEDLLLKSSDSVYDTLNKEILSVYNGGVV